MGPRTVSLYKYALFKAGSTVGLVPVEDLRRSKGGEIYKMKRCKSKEALSSQSTALNVSEYVTVR